jgi:hypothetical protein
MSLYDKTNSKPHVIRILQNACMDFEACQLQRLSAHTDISNKKLTTE